MATYKTPGVYVEEISLIPPSVAEVETAIPAFIGYTEKAEKKGENLTNVPTRISSLLEFKELFGGEYEIKSLKVVVDESNNWAVVDPITIDKRYYMYESLRLFYDNGGGDCYIVSVGAYGKDVAPGDENDAQKKPGLRVGLKALEKYDEPTIILFPDAVLLSDEADFYSLQQAALSQCAKLQDRVAVLDLREAGVEWKQSYADFRDQIGINNLKYGAAYTPWIYSSFPKEVDFSLIRDSVEETSSKKILKLSSLTSDTDLNELVSNAEAAINDRDEVVEALVKDRTGSSPTLRDEYKQLKDGLDSSQTRAANNQAFQILMEFVRDLAAGDKTPSPDIDGFSSWKTSVKGKNLSKDLDAYAASALKPALESLVKLEKDLTALPTAPSDGAVDSGLTNENAVNNRYSSLDDTNWLSQKVSAIATSNKDYSDAGAKTHFETLQAVLADLDDIVFKKEKESLLGFIASIEEAADTHAQLAQQTLYQKHTVIGNMVENIKRELAKVPPSGAVAGVYADVDRTRGVWKAPANVSLSSVRGPVVPIDFFDQENLNVDVNGGKSINAIRTFSGRGAAVVWGARTLAGNDNEWRYVPVRRFFNMVEESVKKSTAWAVFEPNAAPLWTKVSGMISNYLIEKWREGALAGAKPDEAFFVKIGLGQTMTAQDILEGRLIVEIGMAVVRPAEFIILRFMHKMQES
ncbi:MAG: phage tail protein [Acidobacteria bacterium]|nr:MAG: phage tail protein [Acidobacteriota bacterium]